MSEGTVLLTKKQVAERLSVTTRTVDKLVASQDGPPSLKIGSCRRFPADALDRWIAEKVAASENRRAA